MSEKIQTEENNSLQTVSSFAVARDLARLTISFLEPSEEMRFFIKSTSLAGGMNTSPAHAADRLSRAKCHYSRFLCFSLPLATQVVQALAGKGLRCMSQQRKWTAL